MHDLPEDFILRPRGIRAEIDNYRAMQEKPWRAPERTRRPRVLRTGLQSMIDALEVDMATIDELQEIHDRK